MNARLTSAFRCAYCCAASGDQHDHGCPQRNCSAADVLNIARARQEWAAYYTRTVGTPPQPNDEARLLPAWLEATRLALATLPPVAKIHHGPAGSFTKSPPALAQLSNGDHLLNTRPLSQESDAMPPGWQFHSADFVKYSLGRRSDGVVTLVRDEQGRRRWNALPNDSPERDSNPLYVWGRGASFHFALQEAIRRACGAVARSALV